MEALVKENTRLVGLLKKVHQVSVEAYNDIIYLNGRVQSLEAENSTVSVENNQLRAKLQNIDDRQAALENISKAIKVAVGEFQKLKDQYDLELQRRSHAEQIVQVLQEKIQKLENLIRFASIQNNNTNVPSLNNPYIKDSTQLRNELLGVHQELRESIEKYEQFKTQLGAKLDAPTGRPRGNTPKSGYNDSRPSTDYTTGYGTMNTFVTSVASPMTPADKAQQRLTQLKSLVGEVDATLHPTPDTNSSRPAHHMPTIRPNLEPVPQHIKTTLKSQIPVTTLELNSTPIATSESIVSTNPSSQTTSRMNRRNSLNTQTVIRKPSVTDSTLQRPISPIVGRKGIHRISKFDEYFDQLQDELLALRSPSEAELNQSRP